MAVVAVKRFIVNNVAYQTVTQSVELLDSGSEKTPIIGDDGTVLDFTEDLKAGMLKGKFSVTQPNMKSLKSLSGGEIIVELKDGRTYVGTNMTRTDNNPEIAAEGTIEMEFMGNVVER